MRLEGGIPPPGNQHPTASFPFGAKRQEGGRCRNKCLRLRKPALRQMGEK